MDTEHGTETATTISGTVGRAEDWTVGSMKMGNVDGHKVMVARTDSGFHAIDNACPHQGYGLTTGVLDGQLVTCQWHNWKFDVTTGACVRGEEDVACHRVDLVDGEVQVTIEVPDQASRQAVLWPSLKRGVENHYVGQIARDSVRLLDTGATPADILAEGVAATAARAEDGIGHELAMTADCLALAEIRTGTEQALPVVQGLAALSEVTRDRPSREVQRPAPEVDVPAAIEVEEVDAAMAGTLGAILEGRDPETVRRALIEAASAHHLGYGHGIIYTQKSFEFLDRVGWDRAPELLPHLAARLTYLTREDTLPYMVGAMRQLAGIDLGMLAETERADGWEPDELADALLTADEAPLTVAATAAARGAGIDGVLDAVSLGASTRLLRHDLEIELDRADPFGWLDITHALTTAQAARWAWTVAPGPATARAALFAVWLLFDAGRSERRHGPSSPDEAIADLLASSDVSPAATDHGAADGLAQAIKRGNVTEAVVSAATGDREAVGIALAEASLADGAGSFIVAAHLVKTAEAARRESAITDSSLPLVAAARFLAAPRLERFVTASVAESVDFVTTGRPPRR
ncbi:MAG: Rieske 2Fe-2S domain-containing protein [Actinomycetota bacterium]